MSLVTVTDHDSIDAVEVLRRHPDFFVSEEVTCAMPSGSQMHVGVYDLNDRQHVEVQRRRSDFASLIAYLREQKLFYSANHIFSSLTGRRILADFECFVSAFDAFETLNGCMLEAANRHAGEFAARTGKIGVGGSDAHTLATTGCCWTEVPCARNKAEFLAGLRHGRATVHGTHGSYFKLTRDILQIGVSMVQTTPLSAPVALLGGLAPVITLVNYLLERRFSHHWGERLGQFQRITPIVSEAAA
jgi:predicted metal-dependent phosphoesterase TrpH